MSRSGRTSWESEDSEITEESVKSANNSLRHVSLVHPYFITRLWEIGVSYPESDKVESKNEDGDSRPPAYTSERLHRSDRISSDIECVKQRVHWAFFIRAMIACGRFDAHSIFRRRTTDVRGISRDLPAHSGAIRGQNDASLHFSNEQKVSSVHPN